jgi:uncharacterized membrane protein YqgA involved in biofilm formation
VIGTIINACCIIIGGLLGLSRRKSLTVAQESWSKVTLGAFAVYYGLRLCLLSFSSPFGHAVKQLLVGVVALMLGNVIGRALRLQDLSNSVGSKARQFMERVTKNPPNPYKRIDTNGFLACSLLFCASPLGIVGALQDGVSGYFYPLIIKGLIDGLATMGFVSMLGWSSVLSALPVFAFQGTISLLAGHYALPFLSDRGLVDAESFAAGLLVFCVALVILQIKKISLANYLPTLIVAPLLAWWFGP